MAVDNALLRDKFEGCLLAGAAGDALGYKIEFWPENEIFQTFGEEGIATLENACSAYDHCAHFSDDTQMTLFTANGLTFGMERTGHAPETRDIWLAYREWLATQGDDSRMDDPLHPKMWLTSRPSLIALRAPGNTCLSAIRTSDWGGTIERPVNHSKGCGGVMRVAPWGLFLGESAAHWDEPRLRDFVREGAQMAALTHGHPLGWISAGALCYLVNRCAFEVPEGADDPRAALEGIVRDCICGLPTWFADVPEDAAYQAELLERAMKLAAGDEPDQPVIFQLGGGWVGEEALAIAVFSALRHADDFAEAIISAANHDGDSDSTAAICGNIVGALLGIDAIGSGWDEVELRDVILEVARNLCDRCQMTEDGVYYDEAWADKYCRYTVRS